VCKAKLFKCFPYPEKRKFLSALPKRQRRQGKQALKKASVKKNISYNRAFPNNQITYQPYIRADIAARRGDYDAVTSSDNNTQRTEARRLLDGALSMRRTR
jgi:hypothetical protein